MCSRMCRLTVVVQHFEFVRYASQQSFRKHLSSFLRGRRLRLLKNVGDIRSEVRRNASEHKVLD
jgi:hypothetical protein